MRSKAVSRPRPIAAAASMVLAAVLFVMLPPWSWIAAGLVLVATSIRRREWPVGLRLAAAAVGVGLLAAGIVPVLDLITGGAALTVLP